MDWITIAVVGACILSSYIWGKTKNWVWFLASNFVIGFVARVVADFFGGFFSGFTKAVGASSRVSESGGLLFAMLVAVLLVMFLSWWSNKKLLKMLPEKWSRR